MLDFRLPGFDSVGASSRARAASETEVYDVVVIGGGPAGTTAVVYACRKGLNTLLVSENIGGQLLWTSGVENFPGFQYITGPELKAKFEAQIRRFPLALELGTRVAHLERTPRGFSVATDNGRRFSGRTAIIATGRNPRRLGITGEQEFTGRGVTYCATCDAPLYAGQDVAVIGGGNSALTSVLDLAAVARTVYSIHRRTEYRGDAVLIDKVMSAANVRRRLGCEPTAIRGTDRVTGVELRNLAGGTSENLAVSGVFVEVGSEPVTGFARDLLSLSPTREIATNCRTETAVPGLFAAGDATTVFENQIVIAAGEGAKAALAAHAWLLSMPKSENAK
jgi:alkyl hydroperoxide reductase subunit F